MHFSFAFYCLFNNSGHKCFLRLLVTIAIKLVTMLFIHFLFKYESLSFVLMALVRNQNFSTVFEQYSTLLKLALSSECQLVTNHDCILM